MYNISVAVRKKTILTVIMVPLLAYTRQRQIRCTSTTFVRRKTDTIPIPVGLLYLLIKGMAWLLLPTALSASTEEALPHPYQWNNFSPEEVANHDEKAARNVLRRMHHVNDITPRDFVEVCVDMKQQGVGGYDSWGARPEPFHQIPANRDYSWGFTLVPVRSASQANEVAKYDYQ